MQRIFISILICLFCSLACSKNQTHNHQELVVALPQEPVLLNPLIVTDIQGSKVSNLIFDGLFKKNQNLEIVPNLVSDFQQPDPKTYDLKIREGVLFHDGKELTTKDIVFTLQAWGNPDIKSPFRPLSQKIADITVKGPYHLVITLQEPFAPFLTALTRGIVPAHLALKPEFETHPVGTGPYRFVSWTKGESLVLAANKKHFDNAPQIPQLIFKIIRDDNTRVLQLLAGEIDLIQNGIPALLLERVKQKEDIAILNEKSIIVAYMGINLREPYLKNKQVRQALSCAINRDKIIQHKWNGYASKADSLLAPVNWAYQAANSDYAYNPEKAKQLLDAAGFPDPDGDGPKPRFQVTLKTSTNKERVAIAEMITHQLRNVGIATRLQTFEWGTFFDDIRNGRFQLFTSTWVGITEPDIYYDVAHSKRIPPNGANRGFYENKKLDGLVEKGRVTVDSATRKQIYQEVQKILADDLPFIPLWYEHNIVVYKKSLQNVDPRSDASYLPFTKITWSQ